MASLPLCSGHGFHIQGPRGPQAASLLYFSLSLHAQIILSEGLGIWRLSLHHPTTPGSLLSLKWEKLPDPLIARNTALGSLTLTSSGSVLVSTSRDNFSFTKTWCFTLPEEFLGTGEKVRVRGWAGSPSPSTWVLVGVRRHPRGDTLCEKLYLPLSRGHNSVIN